MPGFNWPFLVDFHAIVEVGKNRLGIICLILNKVTISSSLYNASVTKVSEKLIFLSAGTCGAKLLIERNIADDY
jgi:hypothetical protein